MKFLIRRIRYAFAGHLMRAIFSIISLILVCGFIFILISGAINQKNMFKVIFSWMWSSSEKVAEGVDSGDIVDITDQGIYLKGRAPDGAKNLNDNSSSSNSDSSKKEDSNSNSPENSDKDSSNENKNADSEKDNDSSKPDSSADSS